MGVRGCGPGGGIQAHLSCRPYPVSSVGRAVEVGNASHSSVPTSLTVSRPCRPPAETGTTRPIRAGPLNARSALEISPIMSSA